MDDLVVIRKFGQRYEAEMAKGLLEKQGIESIIQADDCGGMRTHLSIGAGGVQLLVKKEHKEKSEEILKTLENK